jgi:signal transduction histidine kinase
MGRLGTAGRRLGRILLVDGAFAAVVGAVMVFGSARAAVGQMPPRRALDALAYALVVSAAVALVGRRVWSSATLVVTAAGTSVYLAVGYPYGPIVFAPIIALYTAAAWWRVGPSLAACGLVTVAVVAPVLWVVADRVDVVAAASARLVFFVGVLPWMVGMVVRSARLGDLRVRVEDERRRVYEERLQIAAEVHDVVGQGLAVIAMQAGVALHVADTRPEQAKTALEAIRRTSRDALDELRGTLAVFRQPDGGEDTLGGAVRHSLPGLGQLDRLVANMADSGLEVQLIVEGQPTALPTMVDLAGYRIVQESLTNVLRHAGPTRSTVRVDYQPDGVVLAITDDGRARVGDEVGSGGHGIAGMRERAAVLGGWLQAGPRSQGGFSVQARLPVGGPRR